MQAETEGDRERNLSSHKQRTKKKKRQTDSKRTDTGRQTDRHAGRDRGRQRSLIGRKQRQKKMNQVNAVTIC